jgi:hypothetical protein
MRRSPWRLAVVSLVCCLALAASGDDVCLVRLAVPSPLTTTLPLDDPNTDFQASVDAGVDLAQNPYQFIASCPAAPLLALFAVPSPLHVAPPSDAYPLHLAVATPIRC